MACATTMATAMETIAGMGGGMDNRTMMVDEIIDEAVIEVAVQGDGEAGAIVDTLRPTDC